MDEKQQQFKESLNILCRLFFSSNLTLEEKLLNEYTNELDLLYSLSRKINCYCPDISINTNKNDNHNSKSEYKYYTPEFNYTSGILHSVKTIQLPYNMLYNYDSVYFWD